MKRCRLPAVSVAALRGVGLFSRFPIHAMDGKSPRQGIGLLSLNAIHCEGFRWFGVIVHKCHFPARRFPYSPIWKMLSTTSTSLRGTPPHSTPLPPPFLPSSTITAACGVKHRQDISASGLCIPPLGSLFGNEEGLGGRGDKEGKGRGLLS